MREIRTYGSVGVSAGNRRHYLAGTEVWVDGQAASFRGGAWENRDGNLSSGAPRDRIRNGTTGCFEKLMGDE